MNIETVFSLVAILFVLILYVALKPRISTKDLKRQMNDHDENSYS